MTSPGTVQPSESEKHQAAVIVGSMSDVVLGRLLKRDIAQALADQRAKYEGLADELDRQAAENAEHPSHSDQLMAAALGVCWHSPTSDR